ncbi:hypothetical protein T552_00276 [Pneumocystis carinii B80]|uniref:SAC domain-containing protein n=1 Tax=Pneumocystis carinii (strain B80) TaxID=1408658 RepID=A0A0W4ZTE2_PNEC8|nr:hypothetical protein T552_00276 [Pneumocystis carinii B80]KTW31637.1 hypothetical protein T552_00276 [Pneumocystis carinii B80]
MNQEILRIYGVLGIIRLKYDKYLIIITEREAVGRIGQDDIFRIKSVRLMSFKGQYKDHEEVGYLNLIKKHLNTGAFYFSYTFDVTNAIQRQIVSETKSPLWKIADERFFWNRFIQSELIDLRGSSHSDLDNYILPVIYGFVKIAPIMIKNNSLTILLISRRSRFRAGTRYFSRGIDENGDVSNFNETEQIVLFENTNKLSGVTKRLKLSFVQIRGSVPIFWAEINNLKYKPKLRVLNINDSVNAARLHFDKQIRIYGDQLVVNLVNQHGRECNIKTSYEEIIKILNDSKIKYFYFDFHQECRKMKWHKTRILINQLTPYLKQNYCYVDCSDQVYPVYFQTSIVRTNCIDCLDRTNVIQSALARWVLTKQLNDIGILNDYENIEDYPDLDNLFRNIWADNADFISISYSGTGALKTDFTRTGKRTKRGELHDLINSIMRYFQNNFTDGSRQDAFDLFLGNYLPYQTRKIPLLYHRSLFIQYIPYVLFFSILMILAKIILPGLENVIISSHIFMVFWLFVFIWSVYFIISNGFYYVNWPKLVPPEFLKYRKVQNVEFYK